MSGPPNVGSGELSRIARKKSPNAPKWRNIEAKLRKRTGLAVWRRMFNMGNISTLPGCLSRLATFLAVSLTRCQLPIPNLIRPTSSKAVSQERALQRDADFTSKWLPQLAELGATLDLPLPRESLSLVVIGA